MACGAVGAHGTRSTKTPVAAELPPCLEAARASALAAHSAAGLCAAARLVAAARLLRSAEALSRAAVAALCAAPRPQAAAPAPSVASGAAAPPASSPSARRRRRRRQKKTTTNITDPSDVDTGMMEALDVGGGHVASNPASAVVSAPSGRVLTAKPSRERSPRRAVDGSGPPSPSPSSVAAASPVGIFLQGSSVSLTGLTSRPELEGVEAEVLSFDATGGRYAIRLTTGEQIRVRPVNVQSPGSAAV